MASSSSSSHKWIYDVFPSFSGEDVRVTFLSHFLKELDRKLIISFKDDETERIGSLDPVLKQAIQTSRIAVVVFSEKFSSSTWCLNELVEIVKCQKEYGQQVIPVFYHLDPSHVRKQTGNFGEAFAKTCQEKTEEETKLWRQSLTEVANILGYHSQKWPSEAIMIEEIANNILGKTGTKKVLGMTRVLRDERPSSKIVTIKSFSTFKNREEPYESSVFEAAGYKWRLVLYVNGNPNDGGSNHISLYVRIEETQSLPIDWEVNVDLKLFVYNGKLNKYLTVTDGAVKQFTDAKKEWGYGKLIPLSTLYNANEEYTAQDTGSFGAEIFIVKSVQQQEKVTFISNPPNNVFTWKIPRLSNLEDKFYYSDDFLVGDRYWRLGFNPKGDGDGRPYALPIYLFAQGFKANAVATNTWGAVNLRLKNQQTSNHRQIYSAAWYPIREDYGVGVNNIILFKDIENGYLVNDSIIFEAEMVNVSVTNIVPA